MKAQFVRAFTGATRSATLLAAISSAGSAIGQFTAANPAANSAASPTPAIRDIRPPLDVFPYPMWMIVTAAAIAAAVIILMIVMIVKAVRSRPNAPPPTPKEIALRRLKEAETDIEAADPYLFSIRVSDILRQFVSAQFHLHATEQTSPEFLAIAARTPHFTEADKRLLAAFLEQCDLIKFAHVDATAADSKILWDQAVKFVDGAAQVEPAVALGGRS